MDPRSDRERHRAGQALDKADQDVDDRARDWDMAKRSHDKEAVNRLGALEPDYQTLTTVSPAPATAWERRSIQHTTPRSRPDLGRVRDKPIDRSLLNPKKDMKTLV